MRLFNKKLLALGLLSGPIFSACLPMKVGVENQCVRLAQGDSYCQNTRNYPSFYQKNPNTSLYAFKTDEKCNRYQSQLWRSSFSETAQKPPVTVSTPTPVTPTPPTTNPTTPVVTTRPEVDEDAHKTPMQRYGFEYRDVLESELDGHYDQEVCDFPPLNNQDIVTDSYNYKVHRLISGLDQKLKLAQKEGRLDELRFRVLRSLDNIYELRNFVGQETEGPIKTRVIKPIKLIKARGPFDKYVNSCDIYNFYQIMSLNHFHHGSHEYYNKVRKALKAPQFQRSALLTDIFYNKKDISAVINDVLRAENINEAIKVNSNTPIIEQRRRSYVWLPNLNAETSKESGKNHTEFLNWNLPTPRDGMKYPYFMLVRMERGNTSKLYLINLIKDVEKTIEVETENGLVKKVIKTPVLTIGQCSDTKCPTFIRNE